tara:strand:+ start:1682 stop:1927 length:246 start_codon:yes stop_codon:yes gene_type:complete
MRNTSTTYISNKNKSYEVMPYDADGETIIEITSSDGSFINQVGIYLEMGRLIDYDGVFALRKVHINALRNAGIVVPRYFED